MYAHRDFWRSTLNDLASGSESPVISKVDKALNGEAQESFSWCLRASAFGKWQVKDREPLQRCQFFRGISGIF
jgi:hypothetical protein